MQLTCSPIAFATLMRASALALALATMALASPSALLICSVLKASEVKICALFLPSATLISDSLIPVGRKLE